MLLHHCLLEKFCNFIVIQKKVIQAMKKTFKIQDKHFGNKQTKGRIASLLELLIAVVKSSEKRLSFANKTLDQLIFYGPE